MMTTEAAVLHLRESPTWGGLVRDAYLGADLYEAATRFHASGEFAEVQRLLAPHLAGGTVLDLGAGTGIASYAFARSGARLVYPLEPDPSDVVGRGAISRTCAGLPVAVLAGVGESIPLPDEHINIVYCRQVLHHVRSLRTTIAECARVLKRGGVFLACREHVVAGPEELRAFLDTHPIHRLAGGENAYPLKNYVNAITDCGLELLRVIRPWDSVINAFPLVHTAQELERRSPKTALSQRYGMIGRVIAWLPGMRHLLWRRMTKPKPGQLYSFLARKPD